MSKQQSTLLPVASTMLPFWATVSKQRSTLSKGRNFNANLVRHCCRFWQQSRTLLRHCCWCGPGFSVLLTCTGFGCRTDSTRPTLCARPWTMTSSSRVLRTRPPSSFLSQAAGPCQPEDSGSYTKVGLYSYIKCLRYRSGVVFLRE